MNEWSRLGWLLDSRPLDSDWIAPCGSLQLAGGPRSGTQFRGDAEEVAPELMSDEFSDLHWSYPWNLTSNDCEFAGWPVGSRNDFYLVGASA